MPNIRLPLQKKDTTGDVQTLSGYVTALRVYPFTSNAIVGTEAADALGYYDYENVEANVAYQKWYGTSLTTMIRDYSFSGDDGRQFYGTGDETLLDVADFTDNQIVYKNPDTDLLEPISIADLLTAENIGTSGGEALNYYAFNGSIQQKNGVSSSKCVALGSATLNTIADSLAPSLSAKISTGRYELGFATDGVQGFKVYGTDDLNSASFSYLWEKYEQQVYQYDANTSSSIHMGSVLVCANAGNGMFDERGAGSIIIETRNPAGDLADDVLEFGQFISIKRYKQG